MEYSIQELSRLSGVTTRALRWYDQIGLLKPGRVAENGYRYYGEAEVDQMCIRDRSLPSSENLLALASLYGVSLDSWPAQAPKKSRTGPFCTKI